MAPAPRPRPVRRALRPAVLAALLAGAAAVPAHTAPPGTTLLVSRPDGFGPPDPGLTNDSSVWGDPGRPPDQSVRVVADDDGNRYVAFTGDGDGLSPDDDDRFTNVYVRDRQTGTTILVSRADGPAGAAADGASHSPAITADGRFVAFVSEAANLSDADEAGTAQVYVRDLVNGTTRLVSRADGGAGVVASDSASQPAVANAGGAPRVAFTSAAANLPGGDGSVPQVYLRAGDDTILVSTVDGDAGQPGGARSGAPSLNVNGTQVAFTSEAPLVPSLDANPWLDVYVRTVANANVRLASRVTPNGAAGDGNSFGASISDDGNRVAFTSRATDLTPADTDASADVFVRQFLLGSTFLVSRASGAGASADADAEGPSISGDGTRVAFTSTAANLVPGDADGRPDVFLRNIGSGATTLLSGGPGGAEGTGTAASISRDGDRVAWQGVSPGREDGDDDDFVQVFTTYTGPLASPFSSGWVSRPTGTGPFRSRVNHSVLRTPSRVEQTTRAMSADGRYTVFASAADNLSGADDDRFVNVYRRDNLTGATVLVSRADGPAGAAANGSSGGVDGVGVPAVASPPAISADGRMVVFESVADNLVPGDANQARDVFARDVVTGATLLVSRADDGAQAPTGGGDPDVSADGTRVVFTTRDPLAGAADDNGAPDVYVRDLVAGTTVLAGRATGAGGSVGPGGTSGGVISGDGRVVAFESEDPLDAAVTDANGTTDVFVRDLTAAQTRQVSRRAQDATQAGDGASFAPAIDGDGSTVAFTSVASDMAGADANGGTRDVFVRRTAGLSTTVLVSRTTGPGGVGGNGASGRPSVSADGTRVVFETAASDLAAGDTNGAQDVVLRDLTAGTTEIVSRAHDGAPVAGHSFNPSLSGDGDCVAFDTAARNVVTGIPDGDFRRVFVRALRGDCPFGPVPPASPPGPGAAPAAATPGPPAPSGRVAADATRPRITLLAVAPARFRVGTRLRPAAPGRAGTGARLRIRVSEAARVTVRVDALVSGRRAGARCVTGARRGRVCVRAVPRGVVGLGRVAGTRTVVFTGRVRGRSLGPGRYRLTALAVDAAGNRSAARSVTVTVLPPAPRR